MFIDVLRELGIDYHDDLSHDDPGALIDSLRDFEIHSEYFHDINGYRVYKGDEVIFEMVELNRELIFDRGYYFKVELEVWTFLDDQIDLGE